MTYQKLITEPMPKYSLGEEIFNYVSHIVGGAIGIFIVVFCSIYGGINHIGGLNILSLIVFGVTTICLYTMSSLYHGLKPNSLSKRIFRIFDHCTIYLLIAGTYTPICVIGLKNTSYCYIILLIEWLGAAIGVTLNALDMNNKYVKIISMILYIILGWGIIAIPGAVKLLSNYQFLMILLGGIGYTIGVIFFSLGSKKKWFHSIFHIFCCIGTILQMFGILDIMFMIKK